MASLAVVADCSGNGHLDAATGLCVCNEGWTSTGDFQPVRGLDCGINIDSITALASVSLILGIIAMVVFIIFLYNSFKGTWNLDLKQRFAVTYLLQTIMCNIYDIAQLINPEDAMYGSTIYLTIIMAIAYATAYGGCVVFFEAVLKLLRGIGKATSPDAQGRMKQSVGLFVARTRYLYSICAITAIVSLVSLVVPADKCHIVARTTFSLWNVFHVAFAYAFNPPMTLIRKELGTFVKQMQMSSESQAFNTNQFEGVRKNMRLAQYCINGLFVVTACIYLVWSASDVLISRTIYVILYCTIGVHVLSVPMLIALTMKSSIASAPSSYSRKAKVACAGSDTISDTGEQDMASFRAKAAFTTIHTSYYERALPGSSILEDGDVEENVVTSTKDPVATVPESTVSDSHA